MIMSFLYMTGVQLNYKQLTVLFQVRGPKGGEG